MRLSEVPTCRVESFVGDWQVECQPASVGEFWYDDFVRGVLNSTCGDACKSIKVSSNLARVRGACA